MPLFASVNESPFELSHNRRSDGPNGASSDAASFARHVFSAQIQHRRLVASVAPRESRVTRINAQIAMRFQNVHDLVAIATLVEYESTPSLMPVESASSFGTSVTANLNVDPCADHPCTPMRKIFRRPDVQAFVQISATHVTPRRVRACTLG